jgi:hypothetical protein
MSVLEITALIALFCSFYILVIVGPAFCGELIRSCR